MRDSIQNTSINTTAGGTCRRESGNMKAYGSVHDRALPDGAERRMKPRMTCRNWQVREQLRLPDAGKSSEATFGSLLLM